MEHEHTPEAIRKRLESGPAVSYLRDWVYGGIDGSVTTFAVVSGVAGASLPSSVIVILGLANLIADGFSMAASNYSGTRTEKQEIDALYAQERRHIETHPEGEREEVRQIFEKRGFAGEDLERAVDVVTADQDRWIRFMLTEELGQPSHVRSAIKAGLSTFAAFAVCGFVPLIPFLLFMADSYAFSLAATLGVFFGIGSVKSRWLIVPWWRAGLAMTED
jgi:vacuolar iron transporter family protein